MKLNHSSHDLQAILNRIDSSIMIQDKVVEFFKSRWSGTVLGPIYGLLIYLYLTYLILNGPPFTPNQNQVQKAKFNHNVENINVKNLTYQQINIESCEFQDMKEKIKSSSTANKCKRQKRNFNESSDFSNQGIESEICQPLMSVETR